MELSDEDKKQFIEAVKKGEEAQVEEWIAAHRGQSLDFVDPDDESERNALHWAACAHSCPLWLCCCSIIHQ